MEIIIELVPCQASMDEELCPRCHHHMTMPGDGGSPSVSGCDQVRVFASNTCSFTSCTGWAPLSPPPKTYSWFPITDDDVWNVLGDGVGWSPLAWSKSWFQDSELVGNFDFLTGRHLQTPRCCEVRRRERSWRVRTGARGPLRWLNPTGVFPDPSCAHLRSSCLDLLPQQ